MEKLKNNLKPLLGGLVVGFILALIIFGYAGYMSAGDARALAVEAVEKSEEGSAAMLVPLASPACAARGRADPEKLAEFMEESSYRQDDYVNSSGWSVYPKDAGPTMIEALDDGCVELLTKSEG